MIVIFFFILFPSGKLPAQMWRQKSKGLVMNKLPSTRVFIAAEKWMLEVLELVALFFLKTETCNAENY